MGAAISPLCCSILLILRMSCLTFASENEDCHFPAIFNFGDSNSDTGGISAAFTPPPWPFGVSSHLPVGRFSDGRLLIDFIAKGLGLPLLHPYLDSIRANFSHGANFATSAATIRAQNSTIMFQHGWSGWSPFFLKIQSWQFNHLKSRSQFAYNREGVFKEFLPKEDYFSRALYTFDIGHNDLTADHYLNMTAAEVSAALTDILDEFVLAVKFFSYQTYLKWGIIDLDVYEEGGRSFWIHNTGPLGCLAYLFEAKPFTEDQMDKAGCAIPWNKLAQSFNKRLNETVIQLRKDLPLAAFTYVDLYSAKYNLFNQPKKFGFEHPLKVCCGSGGKYNFNISARCGAGIMVNGTESVVGPCKNPSTRISWDGVHYTEAANRKVFEQIVNGAFSYPPIPLRKACHKEALPSTS